MNKEDANQFDDKEWSSLIKDWQAQPVKDIDARILLSKIKRRSWVIWIMSMFDVIAVLGCFIGGVLVWFTPDKSKEVASLLFLMCGWGAVILYFELKLRKGTWQIKDQGNESILAFSIRRCEVAIRIGRFFTPALVSVTLLIAIWQIVVYWMSGKLYGIFMMASVIWFVVVILVSKWFIVRKQKELNKLKQML